MGEEQPRKRLGPEELERLKEEVERRQELGDEERSITVNHIREWYIEDQAEGILVEELLEKFPFLEGILVELGLI